MFFFWIAALILALGGAGLWWADRRFKQLWQGEVQALFAAAQPLPRTYHESDLAGLPDPVQRYLRRCLPDGQPYIQYTRLRQRGGLRLKPDAKWMPMAAQQYFTAEPPGFVWVTRVRMMGLPIVGRDSYAGGRGQMLIKLLAALAVVDAHGPKIDAGAFIRLAGEFMWFPTAFLPGECIRWEAVDDSSARVLVCDGDLRITLTMQFDAAGDLLSVTSDERYQGDEPQPTRWIAHVFRYDTFQGVRVPVEAEVGWEDAEHGYWAYWRATLYDVEHNVPALFG